MGWYYTQDSTLKSIIEECTANWEHTREDGTHVKCETLTKCFRGAVTHKGVLWAVCQHTTTRPNGEVVVQKWIRCDLLQRQNGYGWGYKPMEESMGPYYYNCPEKYLKMVPVANQEWRDGVVEYHARRRAKRAEKKSKQRPFAVYC